MRTLLRSTVALLFKEVQHHTPMAVVLGVLTVPVVLVGMVLAMGTGGASVASVGTGVVYYWLPIVVMVLVHRLVVLERADGTHSFLTALPPPAWLCLGVKGVVALAVTWFLGLTTLGGILLIASARELITVFWALQLLIAAGLYLTAWVAVTFAIDHLGRYRSWLWLTLFASMALLDEQADWQAWTWLAALSNPTDATRHAVPWGDLIATSAWIGIGGLTALTLATWRGGALPDRWFQASSTRDRVAGASLVVLWMFVVEVVPELGTPDLVGWDTLPRAVETDPSVRLVDPALAEHGVELSDALRRLDAWSALEPGVTVVLAPDSLEPQRHAYPVRTWSRDRSTLVLRVASEPGPGFVARCIDALLDQRSSGLLRNAVDRGWLRDGLGLYVAETDDTQISEYRAAWAVARGLQEPDLADWEGIRRRHGADVAAGIAAIGMRVLVQRRGREPVGELVGRALLTPLSGGPHDVRTQRRSGRALTAMPLDASAWWSALQDAAAARDLAAMTPQQLLPEVVWTLEPPTRASLEVGWTLDDKVPYGTEVVIRPLDPLRSVYLDNSPEWIAPVTGREGSLPTWAPGWHHVEATLRWWDPRLEAHVVTGWTEVAP